MPGPGEFNPPADPTAGAEYSFGGVTWEFDAQFGVWNISDGTIIGGDGPPGPAGPAGPAGPPGAAGTIVVATSAITGVAMFDSDDFTVSPEGLVSATDDTITILASGNGGANTSSSLDVLSNGQGTLSFTGPVGAGIAVTTSGAGSSTVTIRNTGVTGIGSDGGPGVTGQVNLVSSNGIQITQNANDFEFQNEWGSLGQADTTLASYVVTRLNGQVGVITTGPTGSMTFRHNSGRLTGSSEFLYGGGNNGGLTFTSDKINISNANLNMTVTGPSITLGRQTTITGGIFTNPSEMCASFTVNDNDLVINGASGSIQRFTVTPSGMVTVKAGSGWNPRNNATETVAVIVNWDGGYLTGQFDGNILHGNPVLFGVTGGVEMFTLMRVNIGGAGLTLGLPIANGLTGKNFNF